MNTNNERSHPHKNTLRNIGAATAAFALTMSALTSESGATKPAIEQGATVAQSETSFTPSPLFSFTEAARQNERINKYAPGIAASLGTHIVSLKGVEVVTDPEDPNTAWVRVGVPTGAGNVIGMVASMAQDSEGVLDPSETSSVFVTQTAVGGHYSLNREGDNWNLDTSSGMQMDTGNAFLAPGSRPAEFTKFYNESSEALEKIVLAKAIQ